MTLIYTNDLTRRIQHVQMQTGVHYYAREFVSLYIFSYKRFKYRYLHVRLKISFSLVDISTFCTHRESRYLLVLTENYAALPILQQQFLKGRDHDPVVIFGSSFPKDQQYTQV